MRSRAAIVLCLLSSLFFAAVFPAAGDEGADRGRPSKRRPLQIAQFPGGRFMSKPPARASDGELRDAVVSGNLEKAAELLEKVGNIDTPIDGATLVEWAVAGGRAEILGLLLERGADPNPKGPGDVTPLMRAAGDGFTEAVRLLLKKGADPKAMNAVGQTALDVAKSKRQADAV
jgi:hypothetical protein